MGGILGSYSLLNSSYLTRALTCGVVGMLMSSKSNCPISKLVLVDIGPFVPKAALDRIGTYLGMEDYFDNVDHYAAHLKKNHAQFGPLTDQEVRHQPETSLPLLL